MVLVGLSWLVYWLLVSVFDVEAIKAVLSVAIIFIVLGLILGERPWEKRF